MTQAQIREIAEKKMVDLNCDYDRIRDVDDRRLRPFDGPRGGGVRPWRIIGKRIAKAREGVERTKLYPLDEAVKLVQERANAKFDETVEIAMNLGVDPKHADQMVRGVVNLPNGTGRTLRVARLRARRQGRRSQGGRRRRRRRRGPGRRRCRAARSTSTAASPRPDMMPLVGRLGKVLGPRGLMPNPKVGTVTMDVAARGQGLQGRRGRVPRREGRHRAGPVGKASFDDGKLVENIKAFVDAVAKAKPHGRQGHLHSARRAQLDHGAGREGRRVEPRRRPALSEVLSTSKSRRVTAGFLFLVHPT